MRKSGILMHVTSLPSPYGIGSMGKCAYEFVDFLCQAGQSYWQVLPLNPTGYGDSPYQAFSSYAGNHYLIDLDLLVEEGLLDPDLFVVGGGLSAAGDILLEPARHSYARYLQAARYRPHAGIVAASAGWRAGMLGVADLAMREISQR